MRRELDPKRVALQLAELRACYVPEAVESARVRLALEQPFRHETLEQRAARSLRELRALDELARYLHRDRR
jgi:hypothetical protein